MTMLNEAGLKVAATVEAQWDGRTFDVMGRADRDRYTERLRAAITAYLASVQGEPVAVKKLEWREPCKATNGCWTAESALGTYSVANDDGWHASRDEVPRDFYFEWSWQDMSVDTLETAKAAAQADFDKRIRSAIITHPADRDGVEAGGWQPMDSAPKGVRGYAWMLLLHGDETDPSVSYGMRYGDQFFAAASFYGGGPSDQRQYVIRETEVLPFGWQHLPTPPASALKGGA